MKRWIVAALLLALVLMLTGCAKGNVDAGQIADADADADNRMFMEVSKERSGKVLVDKETGVMYWMSCGACNTGNLTLLIDAEGKPRIWEG